eukprot:g13196.t1 g13196   contig8:137322-138090(-)
MVSELSLVSGCSNIFRLSMMPSSAEDVPPDLNGRNLLNQFIQVTTFDSSSDFGEEGIIPMAMSGAFAQEFPIFMMAEDFVAAASGAYVLGFDITGAVAEPFAVGSVQGGLNGKYSMDKWNGHLRLSTQSFDTNKTIHNKIFVLRIPGQEVGSSVMQAYVSAAAGDSNLFIVMDLSDHTNPQVVGEISSALSSSMSILQRL